MLYNDNMSPYDANTADEPLFGESYNEKTLLVDNEEYEEFWSSVYVKQRSCFIG